MKYSILVFIFHSMFMGLFFVNTAKAVTLHGFAGKTHAAIPSDCSGFSLSTSYDALSFCIQDSSLNDDQRALMNESAKYAYHGGTPPPIVSVEGYFYQGNMYVRNVTELECIGSCSKCDDLPHSFLYVCVNQMDSPISCKKECQHHW